MLTFQLKAFRKEKHRFAALRWLEIRNRSILRLNENLMRNDNSLN
jgi:hypothetical protein